MWLRLLVLLVIPVIAAGCCDRMTCTAVPPGSYNNANGGA